MDDASRATCDGRLKRDLREQRGLDELRLRQWSCDPQQRFRRKHRRAFFQRPHLSGELKMRQILLEELPPYALKIRKTAEMLDVLGAKAKALQVLQRLLQPGRN